MVEVVRDNNRRLSALSATFGYLREDILRGIPPNAAYEGFLRRAIKYDLLTAEDIRQATQAVLPSPPDPPLQQYTYYDLSYDARTKLFSVARGEPFHLSRDRTRFLAHLIVHPEIVHRKETLYATVWREDYSEFIGGAANLRSLAKYVRIETADTVIPKSQLPKNKQFGKVTFHRIQCVYEEGYILKRVWDLDEIAQGKDRLWTPAGFKGS